MGFRGNGQFLGGKLRSSASVTNARTSGGRDVFGASSQTSYELFWSTRATLSTRYAQYSAFGTRPAFRENFVTLGVTRSF
jgi:hypothetical protein